MWLWLLAAAKQERWLVTAEGRLQSALQTSSNPDVAGVEHEAARVPIARTEPGPEDPGPQGPETDREHGHGEEVQHVHKTHRASPAEFAVSAVLFAVIVLVGVLFILVSSADLEVVAYTWKVIASTLSIFCATILYQSGAQLAGHARIQSAFVPAFFWVLALEWSLKASAKNATDEEMSGVRSVSALLAHTAGFAWMLAWAELQQSCFVALPGGLWLVPLFAFAAWFTLFLAAGFFRYRSIHADGIVDPAELLWEHEAKEAEHEAAGLCCAFLLVQGLRYNIGGTLPDSHGKETTGGRAHTGMQVAMLALVGVSLAAVAAGLKRLRPEREVAQRATSALFETSVFAGSWCVVFSLQWGIQQRLEGAEARTLLRVLVAFVASFLALGCMRAVEIVGVKSHSMRARDAIVGGVGSLGIMVGFTWERVFEESANDISFSFGRSMTGGMKAPDCDEECKRWATVGQVVLTVAALSTTAAVLRYYIMPRVIGSQRRAEVHRLAPGDSVVVSGD